MSTQPSHIDVAAPRPRLGAPHIALLLGILSVPGSLLPWDWFTAGGLVVGLPLAIAAIVVGLRARSRGEGRAMATIGVALGVVAVLIPVVWTIAGLLG